MALLPRSRTARRRLAVIAVAGPILALAAGLALFGLRNSISYFYTPSQARAAHVGADQAIQLGGLVTAGSVAKGADGATRFIVSDRQGSAPVIFRGDLPDLFREGQGVVAEGRLGADGGFVADEVLAKHDEKYMPPEVAAALKKNGEWRPTTP